MCDYFWFCDVTFLIGKISIWSLKIAGFWFLNPLPSTLRFRSSLKRNGWVSLDLYHRIANVLKIFKKKKILRLSSGLQRDPSPQNFNSDPSSRLPIHYLLIAINKIFEQIRLSTNYSLVL